MKYDDASWHYGGKFPKDLPESAGATHTGMLWRGHYCQICRTHLGKAAIRAAVRK